jgi:hypothetical protein
MYGVAAVLLGLLLCLFGCCLLLPVPIASLQNLQTLQKL